MAAADVEAATRLGKNLIKTATKMKTKTTTIHEGTSRNWTFHEWLKNELTNIIH